MIIRNLQAQCKKLYHPVFIQLHEFAKFSGEHQRRRVSEVYKSEITIGTHLPIKHGRDLTRIFFFSSSQCIAGCDRLRQTKVDVFKQLRRCSSVLIKLGEHESMKCVVYGGCNLGRNNSVSLSIDQKNARCTAQLR